MEIVWKRYQVGIFGCLILFLSLGCLVEESSPSTFDEELRFNLQAQSTAWEEWQEGENLLNQAKSKEAYTQFGLTARSYQQASHPIGTFWSQLKMAELVARRRQDSARLDSIIGEMEQSMLGIPEGDFHNWAKQLLVYSKGLTWYGARPYAADSALGHLHALIEYCERQSDPTYEAFLSKLYFLSGDIYFQGIGDHRMAATYLEKSLLIDLKGEPTLELSGRLLIYGWVKAMEGEYDLALAVQQQTLAIRHYFLGEDHPQVANAWNQIGKSYYERDEYIKAKEAYQQAYEIAKRANKDKRYTIYEFIYLNNLTTTIEQLGEIDLAEKYYKKAQSLIENNQDQNSLGFHQNIVFNYLNRAALYINQEKYLSAKKLLQAADSLAILYENPEFVQYSKILFLQSELFFEQQKYKEAKQKVSLAKDYFGISKKDDRFISSQEFEPQLIFDLFALSAKINYESNPHRLENLHKTVQDLQFLLEYANQIKWHSLLEEDKLYSGESVYDQLVFALNTTYTLFQKTKKDIYKEQLVSLMELGKSQVLAQELAKAELAQKSLKKQAYFLASLNSLLGEPMPIDSISSYEELSKKQYRLNRLFNQIHLQAQLNEDLSEGERDQPFSNQTIDTKLTQFIPKTKELVLIYQVADSNLFEFSISKGKTWIRRIAIGTELLDRIADFKLLLKENSGEGRNQVLAHDGFDLYQRLLEPSLTFHFGEKKSQLDLISIIPDGFLHHLPFELFLTAESESTGFKDMPFLIKTLPVNYVFSLQLLQKARNAQTIQADDFNQLLSVNLFERESKEKFSKDIYQTFSAPKWKLGTSPEDKLNFVHLAPKSDILQIITHGYSSMGKGTPYLLFSGSDSLHNRIYANELATLPLQAKLVVLAACQGGVGKISIGEGSINLLRAFRIAGATNLIGGLWDVPTMPLPAILEEFYANLRQGMEIPKALQQSKLKYLEQAGTLEADPMFWGVLVAYSQ